MVATVLWIGSLAAIMFIVLPSAQRNLTTQDYANLLDNIQRRLDPIGWFSLAILAATGLIQMSANPNYQGFLTIQSRWASAIFIKHLLYFLMIANSAYLTWYIFPKIRRAALLDSRIAQKTNKANELDGGIFTTSLRRKEALLLWINLALGALILALTAIARASN